MKKFILFCLMFCLPFTIYAQKCAVLEFRGARSVSVSDVDGISEMFMTYFRPTGYTMVERTQIDKVISEQGFQHSSLTDGQAVQLGKILNVSKVVLGTVSMLGGEYQVDVRVVDVQLGHDIAMEGASFNGNYRTNVQNLATKLAEQIAIRPVTTTQPSITVVQEYVDLGLPSGTLWKATNEKDGFLTHAQAKAKYGNQLPTTYQWEELIGMCTWTEINKGYKVTGPNGKSITIPCTGYRTWKYEIDGVGEQCWYWAAESRPGGRANTFNNDQYKPDMSSMPSDNGFSVRLVKR